MEKAGRRRHFQDDDHGRSRQFVIRCVKLATDQRITELVFLCLNLKDSQNEPYKMTEI